MSHAMKLHPLAWIPTLYTAEGIPNVIVCSVALYMFQRVGLSNADTAFFVAWLYLPWVIKPFWSPIVDMIGSKRLWILLMQILIGGALAGVALSLPGGHILTYGMAFLWIIAFSSATHDIAADGFYMLELHPHEQALYVGVRSTFYRIAGILGQGVLVMLAGVLEARTGNPLQAWSLTFGSAAALFLLLATAHAFLLPHPVSDQMHRLRLETLRRTVADMGGTVVSFVKKRQFLLAVTFMLIYRLAEALLTPISRLFLIDNVDAGGLGLTTGQVGFVQGTIGVGGLLLGGILGGIAIAAKGFNRWKWWMAAAITLPNIVYLYLGYFQTQNLFLVSSCVFIEQFGYGFGFTAYMIYLLYFSQGKSPVSHYAFCTGFMALSMMLPGMVAGYLQDMMGYLNFFILVMAICPLTFLVMYLVKVPSGFGRK